MKFLVNPVEILQDPLCSLCIRVCPYDFCDNCAYCPHECYYHNCTKVNPISPESFNY